MHKEAVFFSLPLPFLFLSFSSLLISQEPIFGVAVTLNLKEMREKNN